jgi:hypothetical protein
MRWLPHACIVSVVTEEGLDELKEAVLELMQADNWAAQVQRMLDCDSKLLDADA